MKMVDTVEAYLSSIDISIIDKPSQLVDNIEDLIILLGAKDEKEAIGSLYQIIGLLETFLNRIIQVVLIAIWNASKNSPEIMSQIAGIFGEKSVNPFFESGAAAVTELAQMMGQLVAKKSKDDKKIESQHVSTKNEVKESQKLLEENTKLKAEIDKLNEKIISENDLLKQREAEIQKMLENNKTQTEKMQNDYDNLLNEYKKLKSENQISSTNIKIQNKENLIKPKIYLSEINLPNINIINDLPKQSIKNSLQKPEKSIAQIEEEIRKFYEEENKKITENLNDKIKSLNTNVIFLFFESEIID